MVYPVDVSLSELESRLLKRPEKPPQRLGLSSDLIMKVASTATLPEAPRVSLLPSVNRRYKQSQENLTASLTDIYSSKAPSKCAIFKKSQTISPAKLLEPRDIA